MFQFFSENRCQAFLTVIIAGFNHLIYLVFAPWIWWFWTKLTLFDIDLLFWPNNHMAIYGALCLVCFFFVIANYITIKCLHVVYN